MILLLYSVSREKEKRERFSPRVEASVTLIRPLQIKTKEERKTPGRRTALPLGSVNSKSAAKYERIEPNGESVVRTEEFNASHVGSIPGVPAGSVFKKFMSFSSTG